MSKQVSDDSKQNSERSEPKAEHHELESQLRKLILTLGRERTQQILAELASIGL